MIINEEDEREAVRVIKTLNKVTQSYIVDRNPLYKDRIIKVRNSTKQELGAYLAKKALGE